MQLLWEDEHLAGHNKAGAAVGGAVNQVREAHMLYGLTPIHNQICDSRFPAAAGGSSSGLILIGKDALRRQGTTSRCCCIVAWASEVGQREQHQCFQIFFVGILIQARHIYLLRDIFPFKSILLRRKTSYKKTVWCVHPAECPQYEL